MAALTEEKPLTGVRKRQQIATANKQMLVWVAIAAVVVSICAVLAWNFVQRIIYQAKVNNRIGETAKVLADNISAIDSLTTEVNKLSTNKNLNLPNLRLDDSTAFQVVLDALPTEDDRTALGASLQDRVLNLSGVSIEQLAVTTGGSGVVITGTDDAVGSSNRPTAQPITFNLGLRGDFISIQEAIKDIERTIRPIIITTISLQGTDDRLQATISATTFYVPRVNYVLGSEEVTP